MKSKQKEIDSLATTIEEYFGVGTMDITYADIAEYIIYNFVIDR